MTYDISISDRYSDHHHNGTEQEQTFRLPQTDGSVKEITRFNQLDDSRFKENLFGLSFRAKYTAENMMLSNTLFFTTLNTPDNSNSGQLTFSPSIFSGNRYSNSFNSDNIYPRWVGSYYFKFDNGLSLNAIPSIHYTYTKSSRHYVSDQTSIITDAKENAITGQLAFQVNKEFNKHHSIDLNLIGIYYYNKVKYSGNTIASPEFNQFAYGGILGYSFTSESLCAKLNAGFAGESNKISGLRTNSLIPLMNLSAQYSFNRKNSINLSAQYNVNPVEASEKTPDVIQENELLYLTGNPYLKNTHWGKMSVDYTWLPNNRLSVNLSSGWSRYFNRPTPLFTPDGSNGTILRSVINDGDYQDLYVTASISAKLLKRRLVLRVAPIMWFEKTTGLYSEKNNYINLNLSGTYYLKNVYFSAYLSTASRMLIQYDMSATSSKSKSTYQFKFGWRKGN